MSRSRWTDFGPILAIESSCDETCAAVVDGLVVRSSIVASQVREHERFGGVVPEVASRNHLQLIDGVIDAALTEAGMTSDEIAAVAVTQGPGLVGALLVGLAAAKVRAWAWNAPLIPVDHLLGHVASAFIAEPELEPPFLCLLASGGHTMLLDVRAGLEVHLIGSTRDDAAGEAFDKGARLLGLSMPGGPHISQLAEDGTAGTVEFTPAMQHRRDTADTSFSGLKTALALACRETPRPRDADLAVAYQTAIVETLVAFVRRGFERFRWPADTERRLAVVGGVAANSLLRSELGRLCAANDVGIVTVPLQYCGDNAAMIGVAAGYHVASATADLLRIDAYAGSRLFRDGVALPTTEP